MPRKSEEEPAFSQEQKLRENIDFTRDLSSGAMIFSREWLLNRGYCCGLGCRNCPYPPHEQRKAGRPNSKRASSED